MKTARFWTRAEEGFEDVRVTARGWSDESIESARAKAREIARRVAERIAGDSGKSQRYPYGDRPLPEPILREFSGAIVTRNVYGALVLNTERLMFVDVDRKDTPKTSGGGLFASLFGKPKPTAPASANPLIDAMKEVSVRHGLSGRLYETAAGYRLLITSAAFQAGTDETEMLLNEFHSDPLYIRLCRMQESFRARLTPKPFRIDFRTPPGEFPFETPSDQAAQDRWVAEYEAKSRLFATCRFVESIGGSVVAPGFDELIQYHDSESKASSGMQLA